MPTAELLKAHFGPPRGEIIGIGEAGNAYEPGHPLGGRAAFWELMCAACEVEVDPDTGEVTVHKLVLVSDVGKALNPHQVEGQDEGAAVMGLGHTLMEQLVLGADGRILNLGSLDYRIPSIKDVPLELESHPDRECRWPWTVRREGRRRRRNACGRGGDRRGDQSGGRRDAARFAADAREDLESAKRKTKNEKRIDHRMAVLIGRTCMKHLTLALLLGAALSAQSADTVESHVAAANALATLRLQLRSSRSASRRRPRAPAARRGEAVNRQRPEAAAPQRAAQQRLPRPTDRAGRASR